VDLETAVALGIDREKSAKLTCRIRFARHKEEGGGSVFGARAPCCRCSRQSVLSRVASAECVRSAGSRRTREALASILHTPRSWRLD
jgi:hypothetical protein